MHHCIAFFYSLFFAMSSWNIYDVLVGGRFQFVCDYTSVQKQTQFVCATIFVVIYQFIFLYSIIHRNDEQSN